MILRLLNTSAFRLSLIYALLFSIVAAVAMGSIYWVAEAQVSQQTDSRLQLETNLLVNLYFSGGSVDSLRETIKVLNQENEEYKYKRPRFYVYALTRNPLALHDSSSSSSPNNANNKQRQEGYFTLTFGEVLSIANFPLEFNDEGGTARTLVTPLRDGWQLLVATGLNEQHALLDKMYKSIVLAILVIFTLALLGGALMGYSVLRRVDSVRKTAGEIINGDLSQRMVVTKRNDEFDRLSVVLNSMLQRIEQLMQGMREVTDNLAHDLRNPLNRLRNRLEAGSFQKPSGEDFQQLQQDALQDVDDLIKTFNALLSIAQAESGVHRDDWGDVNLEQLIGDMGELYEVVAEEEGSQFNYYCMPGLSVHGNRQLLAQAITNLLDNAVKYTPPGGCIELRAEREHGQVLISVSDSGPGIPEAQQGRVFERFVRLDNARSTPGNGLGLSLVRAVTDLHEAEIRLENRRPGLRVVLVFSAERPTLPLVGKNLQGNKTGIV